MKYIHKIAGIHLLLLSTAFTCSMGDNSLKLAPVTMGDGLITFVPIPNISLKGNSTVNLIIGKPYVESGVLAVDGVQIETLTKTGSVNIYKPGTYTITYTVIDTNGHKSILTRTVVVNTLDALLPHDTNSYFAPYAERDYLYFADPQPSENGLNRAIRVNYNTMSYDANNDSLELTEDRYLIPGNTHSNPHSIDRAGKTNKFYVRTQNAYSFDVVAVENGKLVYKKTVPLSLILGNQEIKYSPRAFGAYNAKYDIQLLSGRNTTANFSMIGIVDVKTDKVVKHIAIPISSTSSATTGHAKWLDADHFALIDRGNHTINVYKISKNSAGKIDVQRTSSLDTVGPLHALERVKEPKNSVDLNTYYAMGESVPGVIHPFVKKLLFDPKTGVLSIAFRQEGGLVTPAESIFKDTSYIGLSAKNIPATTHHMNSTPDGKYLIVPVYDGKIYKIDRVSMEVEQKVLDTGTQKGLGAAHIEFSNTLNIAVITNHWSPYITIVDISNNQFSIKGYLKIYRDGHHDVYDPTNKHLMQPHFAQMSKDGKYFYTFASQDNGRFVKVNLDEVLKLSKDANDVFQFDNNSDDSKVMKSIYVEGAPEQAHS